MTDQYTDAGVESGVSEDAFEQDPVLAEYQTPDEQDKWIKELEASRKERKKFDKTAAATIERYADKRDDAAKNRSRYNLFTSNTDMKLAALFAQTPKADISRRFDDADDDVARVAAYLLARNIDYELECDDFKHTFKQALFDWKVPGVGVNWVRFEQEGGEPTVQVTADPLTGQPIEVPAVTEITQQFAHVDYVSWDDFLWSPCAVWTQCRWVCRRVPMSRDDIKQRFSQTCAPEVLESLTFEKPQADQTDAMNKLKPQNVTEQMVDVFEFWDKERRLTFWIALEAAVPLDVQGDANEFEGFFPTPLPPLGRFDTSNALPISDYSLVQDLYRELDNLNNRVFALIDAMKLRFLYDAGNSDLATLFTDAAELEGIPVKDWAVFNEKGGMQGAVQFTDNVLSSTVQSYQAAIAAREQVKAQIFEIEGISDIMRAAATPYETATATATKATFGSSRLSMDQRQTADYIARVLRLKAHLICKLYTPEFILKRAGVIPVADQQFIQPAMALLKNAQMSHFRLHVSTDSIELPNWNQKTQEKTVVVQAISSIAGQLLPAAEQNPEAVPFLAYLTKWMVSGLKGSDEIEGYLDKTLDQLQRAVAAKQGQPKPPTPDQLKAQQHAADQQAAYAIAQLKAQSQQQIAVVQAEAKKQAAAMQAQVDEIKAMYDAKFREQELQIKAFNARTDATRAAHENAVDIVSLGGQ